MPENSTRRNEPPRPHQLPFAEDEIAAALTRVVPLEQARDAAAALIRNLEVSLGSLVSAGDALGEALPQASLLAALAAHSRDFATRSDVYVRQRLRDREAFDALFAQSHGLVSPSFEERWLAWEALKARVARTTESAD